MGCFNKSCAITGLQITHYDPIVGIKLKKSETSHRYKDEGFDHIGSEWYPIEFPIRGIYDDYGRIEVDGKLYEGDEDKDYDSTRCDDYMFMHEWAYDLILEHAEKEKAKVSDVYRDWEKEDFKQLEESFDEIRLSDNEAVKRINEMTIRSISNRWFQYYFAHENKTYWFEKLFTDNFEEFRERIQKFNRELGTIEEYRTEFGVRWEPSIVTGQEVDYKLRLAMLKRSEEYIKDQMEEYDYD